MIMQFWFIFDLSNGTIKENHLLQTEQWTNIPGGCGVIGPLANTDSKAKDAFSNPDFYTVQGGVLTPVADIEQRRVAREAGRQAQQSMPTIEDRLKATEDMLMEIVLGGM